MATRRPLYSILKGQAAFGLLGVLLIQLTGTKLKLESFPNPGAFIWGLIIGGALFALVLLTARSRSVIGASFRKEFDQTSKAIGSLSLPAILILSLAAGFSEEILFRGFFQTWLSETLHYSVGMGVSAVLFGLLHFGSVTKLIFTALYGLLFGIVYHITESLVLVATWHATYDFLALYLIVKAPKFFQVNPSQA